MTNFDDGSTPWQRLARTAYTSYARTVGGETFDGRSLPAWWKLTDLVRSAWEAAARAVVIDADAHVAATPPELHPATTNLLRAIDRGEDIAGPYQLWHQAGRPNLS